MPPSRLSARDRPPISAGVPNEDVKDLPEEEFKDFLKSYDEDIMTAGGLYPTLDSALKEDLKMNEKNILQQQGLISRVYVISQTI